MTPDRQIGPIFVRTLRHFFPLWNTWLEQLPDRRDQDAITYPRRFLACWGILLYVLQLGSRRQLDYQLRAEGTQVLGNLHRLLDTQLTTRPVHDTLDYFAEHTTVAGSERLRTQRNQRLLRMKVFDATRVLGHVPLITDGTGHLVFGKKHCDRCLRQRQGKRTLYLHQVLEAKFIGPAGLAFDFLHSLEIVGILSADDEPAGRPVFDEIVKGQGGPAAARPAYDHEQGCKGHAQPRDEQHQSPRRMNSVHRARSPPLNELDKHRSRWGG